MASQQQLRKQTTQTRVKAKTTQVVKSRQEEKQRQADAKAKAEAEKAAKKLAEERARAEAEAQKVVIGGESFSRETIKKAYHNINKVIAGRTAPEIDKRVVAAMRKIIASDESIDKAMMRGSAAKQQALKAGFKTVAKFQEGVQMAKRVGGDVLVTGTGNVLAGQKVALTKAGATKIQEEIRIKTQADLPRPGWVSFSESIRDDAVAEGEEIYRRSQKEGWTQAQYDEAIKNSKLGSLGEYAGRIRNIKDMSTKPDAGKPDKTYADIFKEKFGIEVSDVYKKTPPLPNIATPLATGIKKAGVEIGGFFSDVADIEIKNNFKVKDIRDIEIYSGKNVRESFVNLFPAAGSGFAVQGDEGTGIVTIGKAAGAFAGAPGKLFNVPVSGLDKGLDPVGAGAEIGGWSRNRVEELKTTARIAIGAPSLYSATVVGYKASKNLIASAGEASARKLGLTQTISSVTPSMAMVDAENMFIETYGERIRAGTITQEEAEKQFKSGTGYKVAQAKFGKDVSAGQTVKLATETAIYGIGSGLGEKTLARGIVGGLALAGGLGYLSKAGKVSVVAKTLKAVDVTYKVGVGLQVPTLFSSESTAQEKVRAGAIVGSYIGMRGIGRFATRKKGLTAKRQKLASKLLREPKGNVLGSISSKTRESIKRTNIGKTRIKATKRPQTKVSLDSSRLKGGMQIDTVKPGQKTSRTISIAPKEKGFKIVDYFSSSANEGTIYRKVRFKKYQVKYSINKGKITYNFYREKGGKIGKKLFSMKRDYTGKTFTGLTEPTLMMESKYKPVDYINPKTRVRHILKTEVKSFKQSMVSMDKKYKVKGSIMSRSRTAVESKIKPLSVKKLKSFRISFKTPGKTRTYSIKGKGKTKLYAAKEGKANPSDIISIKKQVATKKYPKLDVKMAKGASSSARTPRAKINVAEQYEEIGGFIRSPVKPELSDKALKHLNRLLKDKRGQLLLGSKPNFNTPGLSNEKMIKLLNAKGAPAVRDFTAKELSTLRQIQIPSADITQSARLGGITNPLLSRTRIDSLSAYKAISNIASAPAFLMKFPTLSANFTPSKVKIVQDVKVDTRVKTLSKSIQTQKPVQATAQVQLQAITPAQVTTTQLTFRDPVPIGETIVPVTVDPPKLLAPSAQPRGRKQKTQQGYSVFVRRRGKFSKVAGVFSRGAAIERGAKTAKQTLAATFKIEKALGKTVVSDNRRARPSVLRDFRTYQIKQGRKTKVEDMWIQKRGKRLSRKSEVVELIGSRGKMKGGRIRIL